MKFNKEGFVLFCFSLSLLSLVLSVMADSFDLTVISVIFTLFTGLGIIFAFTTIVIITFMYAFFDKV